GNGRRLTSPTGAAFADQLEEVGPGQFPKQHGEVGVVLPVEQRERDHWTHKPTSIQIAQSVIAQLGSTGRTGSTSSANACRWPWSGDRPADWRNKEEKTRRKVSQRKWCLTGVRVRKSRARMPRPIPTPHGQARGERIGRQVATVPMIARG